MIEISGSNSTETRTTIQWFLLEQVPSFLEVQAELHADAEAFPDEEPDEDGIDMRLARVEVRPFVVPRGPIAVSPTAAQALARRAHVRISVGPSGDEEPE